ncbi:MAG: hypothetical protein ACXVRS_14535 [Gaiellaceae bacterium]|jgi:hypothetical protein
MIRKHFRLKKIALGLAFATLVVAPTAQARVALVDGHAAPISYTAVSHQRIASEISVQSGVPQLQVEGLRWQAMAKAYENSPGITAAGAALSNAKHTAYPVSVVQTTTSDGFNWSDAGIGASVAFGAALMLLLAVVLGRRFRSRPTGLAST